MTTTDSTGTFSSGILIGNQASGYPVTPTLSAGGVKTSSVLELQSTDQGFTPPRMTTAQINAIVTTTPGMQAYDTTIDAPVVKTTDTWVSSVFRKTVTLTRANILAMNAGAIALLPSPGVGKMILILKATLLNKFVTTAFANGGAVTIQYVGQGNALTATIPATFVNNAAVPSVFWNLFGETAGAATAITNRDALGIEIINATGAFTGGNAASTIDVTLLYTVVSTV